MVRARRRWLEANELFAIIAAVLCTIAVLSPVLVPGGYLIVTR
jgi:sorbitol-specific phosphotransferase system component IIBC